MDRANSSLDKLHQVDLNIMKVVVSICDLHGLVYFMIGGTMLGAVRHQGFIPWDDDVDLGMPREDYEKFLEIAPQELPSHMCVVNYRNSPSYQYYFTRILDKETKVIEERIGNENSNTHASIDVFPIDGTPNLSLIRKIYFFRLLYHRALMSVCYRDSIDQKRKRGVAEKGLLLILLKLPIGKMTTPYKQKCKLDKLLRKYKVENSNYIGTFMGSYRTKEIVPKEFYGEGAMYRFEDTEFRGLEKYNEYLTQMYGDYMLLPSEEERDSKTHFRVVEIDGEKIQ